jgi:hypothetical protein
MPVITLPDGSKREYRKPLTVAEVAASIGAGLAKAATGRPRRWRAGRYLVPDRIATPNWPSSPTRMPTAWTSSAIRPRT